jgi:predicted kinase
MKMNKITLMCGVARSGKTTWVNNNKKDTDIIISADEIRKIVYGQRFWQDGESIMWSIRTMMLEYLMKQGKDIIIDETNTTKKRRFSIIKLANKHNYIIGINVITGITEEECKKRAIETDMSDLLSIIEYQYKNFELPVKEEGFNFVNMV